MSPSIFGLTYNVPLGGKSALLFGARYFHNAYGETLRPTTATVAWRRRGIPIRPGEDQKRRHDRSNKEDPHHDEYGNWGVNAGLSLLLGKHCKKDANSVTVTPSSATVARGEQDKLHGQQR